MAPQIFLENKNMKILLLQHFGISYALRRYHQPLPLLAECLVQEQALVGESHAHAVLSAGLFHLKLLHE